jgi:hypothetical protein
MFGLFFGRVGVKMRYAESKQQGVTAMANDPPSHLQMGFGYHQARAAGWMASGKRAQRGTSMT